MRTGRFFYVCNMTDTTFLYKLTNQLINQFGDDLPLVKIILPNKRAKIFLEDAIKNSISTTIFSPKIISIEELLFEITQITPIDPIALLFEFYEVYLECTPKEATQSFDKFSSWATILLQDFNEIDRYLLDPKHVLSYLKDIEDIKHWSLDLEKRTSLIDNYLSFWSRLLYYYETLYSRLLNKKQGYQGLIYRESEKKLKNIALNTLDSPLVFAGFNALNAAEEKIFQHFALQNKATIFWDIDTIFFNDSFHEAGLFARKYKKDWPYYKEHSFDWIINEFSDKKNISIIGTPKSVGQTRIVGSVLENIPVISYSNTAVVLGDENLLMPLLYSLPDSVDKVNITMGLPAKNNPVQIFFNKLFRLHSNAINRGSTYVFYYKELLDILSHPIMASLLDTHQLIQTIKERNITFISQDRLAVLAQANTNTTLFNLLFNPWNNNVLAVIEQIFGIIHHIKESLNKTEETDRLTKVFLYTIYNVFVRLKNYFIQYPTGATLELLFSLYKQVVQLAEVSFEGEPLGGLQIMGVLESRVLDFENVIITSLNEGTLPAGKSTQSFIPYDVKVELGLPTYKEKDAIYTYHFYHLLTRAKNIYLLYNTESEGLDAGEKSRFITQLEIEKQPNHSITHKIYAPYLPPKAYSPVVIIKSEGVQARLREIATKGFSPSSLTNYLRNPLQFYYQRIIGISEAEEVEENIALNTLGTIIHRTLKVLYEPYLNVFLTEENILSMKLLVDQTIKIQFEEVFSEGDVLRGKNLLAYEVARRNVYNLLKKELEWIQEGDVVKIIALEQKYQRTLSHTKLPYDVVIAGEVDRIEERNGKIRIVDYKTGKVEPAKLIIKHWDALLDIQYDKVIQLLAYAFMYAPNVKNKEIEAGIISFKNLKEGFMPFYYSEEKEKTSDINQLVLENYQEKIVDLLVEILDPKEPFTENVV